MRNFRFYNKYSEIFSWFWLSLLLLSCFDYFYLSWKDSYGNLLGLYALQFLLFSAIILHQKKFHFTVFQIFSAAIVCRLVLLFTEPVLENDYFRYLWDGHVFSQGISPYAYAPNHPFLDSITTGYRKYISFSNISTIYPPFAQYVFLISNFLAPHSLMGLKIIFTLFDLATGILIFSWMKKRNIHPTWSLLYFLNPLVFKEIANSAHIDSIAAFLSTLALYFFSYKRKAGAWVILGLATCTKIYPLVLVPIFLMWDKKRIRNGFLYLATILLLYLPFLYQEGLLFSGTKAYARTWVFNASIFQIANFFLDLIVQPFQSIPWVAKAHDFSYFTKGLMAIFFLLGSTYKLYKMKSEEDIPSTALWILGLLLILSPVLNAWYVLWLLPLACLERSVPWLSFTFLVVGAYSWFYSKEWVLTFRSLEYGIFFMLLTYPFWKRAWKNGISKYKPKYFNSSTDSS